MHRTCHIVLLRHVRQEKSAVLNRIHPRQHAVQITQRRALARDIDHIGRAPMQHEAARIHKLDHVRQRNTPFQMTAAGDGALILLLQNHARKQRPGHILRRLAHGDLACFRAAVNFEKRRLQCRFGFARQLQRQGSGGTQNTFNTGKGYACIRQGLQMHGRGHQHARRGRCRQRVCHVGRVKRPFAPQAVPGHQRLQNNRLKAIHMLRRHRTHQTPCSLPLRRL